MGSLTLPSSGDVYLDTPPIIYSIETIDPYWALLEPLWRAAQVGQITIVSSELAILETLIGPIKSNDSALEAAYEQLFRASEVRTLPITRAILREAANLRAAVGMLRTPDALHAATALSAGATMFLTNDRDFLTVPGLPVTVLDDVLSS